MLDTIKVCTLCMVEVSEKYKASVNEYSVLLTMSSETA